MTTKAELEQQLLKALQIAKSNRLAANASMAAAIAYRHAFYQKICQQWLAEKMAERDGGYSKFQAVHDLARKLLDEDPKQSVRSVAQFVHEQVKNNPEAFELADDTVPTEQTVYKNLLKHQKEK